MLHNKAPGPDKIPNYAIKNLPDTIIRLIACIYDGCPALNHFREPWKLAKIVPVLKAGKNRFLETSYRPISLLNTIGKTFENFIPFRMLDHMRENGVLNNDQFPVKAYGTEFPPKIVKTIKAYLSGRSFQIFSNGVTSGRRPVRAGVPRGSAPGPVLFILYINDIPKPTDRRVYNCIYADDTAVVATSKSPSLVSQSLQVQTDKIVNYYLKWGLKVNPDETRAVIFTNRLITTPTTNNFGNQIEWTNVLQYLGIFLDSKLNHRVHIKHIRGKAINRLKSIAPLLRHKDLTPNAKLTLQIVHPTNPDSRLPSLTGRCYYEQKVSGGGPE